MRYTKSHKHSDKKSKYNNTKKYYDGILFDSKKELNRYCELKMLEKAGKIKNLQRQVTFELSPAYYEVLPEVYKKGKNKGQHKKGDVIEKSCKYIADFVYTDTETGKTVVEDVKGFKTDVYKLKKKWLYDKKRIRITEV